MFLFGVLVLIGLVYLFASPLVTAATNFGHELPSLIDKAKKGHGWLGHLVYRFHLQKYLSESSSKITSQITKVLKPATAFSVGAAAFSTLVSIVTIAILTFFTMLEAPKMWGGFLGVFQPHDERPPAPGDRRDDPLHHRLHGRQLPDLDHRRRGVGRHAGHPRRAVRARCSAIFVALVDLLPLVGGLLAGVPVVIIAVIHSVTAGIVMLVVFLVYQQIENHILNPVIMSKTVRLNPFWVLLAVLVGRTLGGPGRGRAGVVRRRAGRHPVRRRHPGDRAGAAQGARHRGDAGADLGTGRRDHRHLSGPDAVVPESCRRFAGRRGAAAAARCAKAWSGGGTGLAAGRTLAGAGAVASPRMPCMRPLVVIPTYNESENIERMLQRVSECLPEAGVLIVDDGSPDGTAELVEAAAERYRDLHLLRRNEKSGLGQRVPGRVSGGGSSAGTTPSSRWTATSRTTRRRCRR